ncbi:MAG TPA: RNase adapter RapZ [Steroidobacteraceae bacterium]|nr:RNase adapter RapZ [Steroidobacteraceae bacterium]
MRLIVVSGLSGSGKSVALDMLEDLDFYCVDNIPAGLLPGFIAYTVRTSETAYRQTAVGLDVRNRPEDLAEVPHLTETLRRSGIGCEMLFLRADKEALLKRFSETRRRHPLSRAGMGLLEALEQEERLLAPLANAADLTVDTSRLSVHELRDLIRERVVERRSAAPSLLFQSFAYRHGVPDDADFVFDARALPNPYWNPALRDLTGRDEPVAQFLDRETEVTRFFEDVRDFVERWLPSLVRSNRSYITVAVGCTGGQHRSVYLAERLATHFRGTQGQALVRHRDLASRRHE